MFFSMFYEITAIEILTAINNAIVINKITSKI